MCEWVIINHTQSINQSNLTCLYCFPSTSKASVNFFVQIFLWLYGSFSLGQIPRSGMAGSYSSCRFNFLRNQSVFQSHCTVLHFISNLSKFHLFYILANTWCGQSSNFSHSNRYAVVSHCGFNLYFPND